MRKTLSITCFALASLLAAQSALADTLLEIYNLAKTNDPGFKAAQATLDSTRQLRGQSTANFLPRLDVGASRNHYDNSYSTIDTTTGLPTIITGSGDSTVYSATLSESLFNYGNIVYNRQTDLSVKQAEANFRAEQQNLIIRVADRYFGVLSALDSLEFTKANKQAIGRQLEQTKQRFDVGLVAITDVHEAQARYDSTVAENIAAENALDSAFEALREITGKYQKQLSTLKANVPLEPPQPNNIDQWTQQAMKQNPLVLANQYAVQYAQQVVKAQRAGYYPKVSLDASYIDNSTTDTSNTSVGISMSLNLYNGGRTSSAVKKAQYDLTYAQENLESTQRQSQRDVRNAYLNVIAGVSRVKALKQAVVSSESALKASEAGFDVGTRTTVDVLLARQNLFDARRNYSQAKYTYITDTLRLKQAGGELTEDDLKKINVWLE